MNKLNYEIRLERDDVDWDSINDIDEDRAPPEDMYYVLGEIRLETDEIFDPIMITNITIKNYIEDIIDNGTPEDLDDPTVIVAIFKSPHTVSESGDNVNRPKQLAMTNLSRLKIPDLTTDTYNLTKFEKLYFKCKNNVDWPQASNQADTDLGLLMSLRNQFPPLSEGFVVWAELYKYLTGFDNDDFDRDNSHRYSKGEKTHKFFLIPMIEIETLPGVVSYSFYTHQTQFQSRNNEETAVARNLFDNQWNVSASHCQSENNKLYTILNATDIFSDWVINQLRPYEYSSDDLEEMNVSDLYKDTINDAEEVFPHIEDDFGINQESEQQELMRSVTINEEEGEVNDGVEPHQNDENVLNDAFIGLSGSSDVSIDGDIINIYPNDNRELVDAVEMYVSNTADAIEIYGIVDNWKIVMHNYNRREFNFDFDDIVDGSISSTLSLLPMEEESRGPTLTTNELENYPTEEVMDGGSLERKIKHLENYIRYKGMYYLPKDIVNDSTRLK